MSFDYRVFVRQVWGGTSRVEVLLRGHLWVEFFLERLLEAALANPEALDMDRRGWRDKLSLCAALGVLDADRVPGLIELNKRRNKLAHDLTADVDQSDTTRLLERGPNEWREGVSRVRDTAGSDEERAAGGVRVGDEVLTSLQSWFLVVLFELEHRVATKIYDNKHQVQIYQAMIEQLADEKFGKTTTRIEAERKVGMPPRPRVGDAFRRPEERQSGEVEGDEAE